MNRIDLLKNVELLLIRDMWTIRLHAWFLHSFHGETTFEDTWTYISNLSIHTHPTEKDFLYQLVFENTIMVYIIEFGITLEQVLNFCKCLNQDDVQSLLLLQQIGKL